MVLYQDWSTLRLRSSVFLVLLFGFVFSCREPLSAQAVNAANQADLVSCQADNAARARVSGIVRDPSGALIDSAIVRFSCGTALSEAHTASDGRFGVELPAGRYQVTASASGFETLTQSDFRVVGQSPQTLNLDLSLGRSTSIVSVVAPGGYVADSSTAATKTGTPLIEIPQSVSVITLDQMDQRNVQALNEALSYTAGVGVQTYGTESRFDWFNIRGFDQSTYGLFRDNSRWQSGQVEGQIDPYELQEIDVIKGPSSVLYGQNTPGGLVNLVTKRPESLQSDELVMNLGSYGRKQVQGDVGGLLDDAGRWRYRLTGLLRYSDTQVNYVPDDRRLIAPALTWTPSAKTTLTLLSDYQYDNTGWSQFLPADGTLFANPYGRIATGFFTGQPGFDFFHRQQWSVGYLFEHRFGDTWTVRQTSRFSKIAFDGDTAFGVGLEADQRTLNRFGFSNNLGLGLYTVDTQAFSHFRAGPTEHSVLIGVDYSHANVDIVSGSSAAPPIDVFSPVYTSTIPTPVPYSSTQQPSYQTGLYFQDQVKLVRKIIVTLSGREDWTQLKTRQLIGTASTTVQNPDAFTGRAGVAYLFDAGLAPYVSYSTSFLPTNGVNFYGVPFKPITGKQIEGGLKYQPKHSSAFVTASYFNIDEHNLQTPDPANPLNQLQTGAVRSRGVEVEAVASLFHGFDVHTSYSYLDEVVTETTDLTQLGKRPTLIPNRLVSAIGSYTVSRTSLAGLGFGFGIRNVGTTAGDPQNTLLLPGYTLFDASVRYDWKRLRFEINATNLGDKTYVPICTTASYCNYGFRRNVIGSVRYRWSSWRELF